MDIKLNILPSTEEGLIDNISKLSLMIHDNSGFFTL